MKAIKEGLKALCSQFKIVIPPFLVESDSVEAIVSLYEIDSDFSDIKFAACSVLKLAEDFGNIRFAKCSSSWGSNVPKWFATVIGETTCSLRMVA
ncbi:unnamed protein product [Citrullus colocynthis]|uniref:RNase H type-1 domain-containing protein n=1 Tax=Citrullus colocynthis TaxID=252529 RepID=A0ABP0YKD6_9ROSI